VSIGVGLRGPAGTKAQIYGRGLEHVSALTFDSSGRLFAATAAATDAGDDAVYVITAAGQTPIKVITGTHTPLGLLWYQNSLFVASKERVDAYSGFDGTHFAASRTVVTLPAGVGEVNGLVAAPDGRLWLGISSPCDHCQPSLPQSGAVVSFLADGTGLTVEATGIRAPVGLAFVPGTNNLLATMNQRDDLGDQTPGDSLSVVRSGQAWGFPGCYGQGGPACTGVPVPVASLDAHGAVSGVGIVTGQLGASIGLSAIVAEWTYGKVQRVELTPSGSSYRGTVTPFLTGLTNPVPVLATSSGVFVGDWATGVVYEVTASS
jgi:glucose/arabinose dehydrogenase